MAVGCCQGTHVLAMARHAGDEPPRAPPAPRRRFDPDSPAFTLDSLIALRLDAASDFVAELAATAAKEAAIEAGLAGVAATWAGLQLDMADHKVGRGAGGPLGRGGRMSRVVAQCSRARSRARQQGRPRPSGAAARAALARGRPCAQGVWKLRSAEAIFSALEDNSVSLSIMKASKHYLAFEKAGGCGAPEFWP